MDRKEFLGTLVALPVGLFLVRCSSSDASSSDPNAPAASPTKSGTQDVFSSSTVSSHFHTFAVDESAFSASATQIDGDTSSAGAHTHSVTISSDQLQQVSTGASVTVTTGSAGGHTHVFTFEKVAATNLHPNPTPNPYP